jgi:uncharacterized protein GlcG (DUF336 family)
MTLKHARAQELVERVMAAAAKEQVKIAVAVVDSGGHLVSAARMDGVGYFNLEAAIGKARASANFGAPTHVLAQLLDQDPLMARALSTVGEFVMLPGGFPIVDDGDQAGGIGVAGAHYAQDLTVIEAALR